MTLLERVMEWLAPAPKCTCKTKPKKIQKASNKKKTRDK